MLEISFRVGFGWTFLILISISTPQFGESLELSGLVVPNYGILHRTTTLQCNFHLGNDTLYAVKWYKDGHEFFRFNPIDSPPIITFQALGISVNVNRSSAHRVHLEPVTLQSKGHYRCEVSADAPSFKTVYQEKVMRVMVLPHKGPKISGVFPWYNIGDNFTGNCSVHKSSPQAKLTWFLNDNEVESHVCNCVSAETVESGRTGDGVVFYNTWTSLYFHLDMNYFKDGSLNVECRATFPQSSVVLKDVVQSNIKAGLGLQYTHMYSGGTRLVTPPTIHFTPILLILSVLLLYYTLSS